MDVEAVYRALGWNDTNAIRADIAAGHGEEKLRAYMGSQGGGGGGEGGGGGGRQFDPNYPQFSFDWAAAEKEALEKLAPYYADLLKESRGDVALAKTRLEEDYTQGKRYNEENYLKAKQRYDEEYNQSLQRIEENFKFDKNYRQEDYLKDKQILEENYGREQQRIIEDHTIGTRIRQEDLATQLAEEKRISAEESRTMNTDLNRRGILFGQIPLGEATSAAPTSDIASRFFLEPLTEKQAARKQAIERAISRQQEIADISKTRGIEDIGTTKTRGLETLNVGNVRSTEQAELGRTRGLGDIAMLQTRGLEDITMQKTRALEQAARDRARLLEDIAIQQPRQERDLEEEKKQRAVLQMAPLKYQQEYGKYQALLSKYNQGG